MGDRERLLEYLEQHGEVTSYEIRVNGLSGNPSQRVNELRDQGHNITAEGFRRDGRPCTRYTLRPDQEQGRSLSGPETGSRGRSSERKRPASGAAAISGEGIQGAQRGGDGPSSAVTALPTLFEVDPPRPMWHYESEAA